MAHFVIFLLRFLVPFSACYYAFYLRFGSPPSGSSNRFVAALRWRSRFPLAVSVFVGEVTCIVTGDFLRHTFSAASLRHAVLYSGWLLVFGIPAAWLGNRLFGTGTPAEHERCR